MQSKKSKKRKTDASQAKQTNTAISQACDCIISKWMNCNYSCCREARNGRWVRPAGCLHKNVCMNFFFSRSTNTRSNKLPSCTSVVNYHHQYLEIVWFNFFFQNLKIRLGVSQSFQLCKVYGMFFVFPSPLFRSLFRSPLGHRHLTSLR